MRYDDHKGFGKLTESQKKTITKVIDVLGDEQYEFMYRGHVPKERIIERMNNNDF